MDLPKEGEIWAHWKGSRYRVESVGRLESDLTPMVAYRNVLSGDRWMRPLSEFLESVDLGYEKDGHTLHPRFQKVSGNELA